MSSKGRNAWRLGNHSDRSLPQSPQEYKRRQIRRPYHHFWVLSDILIARGVQHHPTGVCVQAVDVENSVFDVASCPLKDLSKIEPRKKKPVIIENRNKRETSKLDVWFFRATLVRVREVRINNWTLEI